MYDIFHLHRAYILINWDEEEKRFRMCLHIINTPFLFMDIMLKWKYHFKIYLK